MQTPVRLHRRALARGGARGRPGRPVAPTTVVNNVSVPAGGTTTATVTNLGGVPAAGRISIFSTTATKVIVRLRAWFSVAPAPDGADWPQYSNLPDHPGINPSESVLTPTTVRQVG